MKEYMVRYKDARGHYHAFSVMANSEEQAREKAHGWMSPMPTTGKVITVEMV